MLSGPDPSVYSLAQVAKMFRSSKKMIKQRALDGELPYVVDHNGHWVFNREDLLPHLDEMIERNDRIG